MTKTEAIEMAKTGWWKTMSAVEIVRFQLYKPVLCMDFSDFHDAAEKALSRGIFTHEFADPDHLKIEFELQHGKAVKS